MNYQEFKRELQQVHCPHIETPLFKHCLKEVLEKQSKSKRERVMSLIENSCDMIVSNRVVVSSVGVSLTVVTIFIGTLMPGNDYAPTKVQAQSVVEEMELASQKLDEHQRKALEERLQMELNHLIKQAKEADTTMVFELDPRVPMRVVDARRQSPSSYLISFGQDQAGRLQIRSVTPRFESIESSGSAFGKRRVLQYASDEGQIIMIDLAENNLPQSGIILAGN